MYNQQPVGKYKLNVCTNLPCQLRDGYRLPPGAQAGHQDGRDHGRGVFTAAVECLGACADSPVMLVNDRCMCSFMSNEKLDELVDGLRAAEGKA
jgi:NADH-quinone oxidoreductase subunit E